jgi:ParB/RepB/Spo0J family partition protein
MATKTCNVKSCNNTLYARGYCQKHYQQFRRNGNITDTLEMVYDILKGECTIEDCDRQLFLHGLCIEHYNEIAKNGVIEEIKEEDHCKVKKCKQPLHKNGLCEGHYEDFNYVHECSTEIRKSIGKRIRQFEPREVKLEEIDEADDTFRIRQALDEDWVEKLASSIASDGLIHPVALREKENGYTIVAGFYRYAAHELLCTWGYDEFKTIDAKVVPQDAMSKEDLIKLAMDENFKRRYVSRLEKALKAKELSYRYSRSQVADLMGTNRDNIKKYLSILNKAAKPVLEALYNRQITLNHAYELMALDKEKQVKWLHWILENDVSVKQLKEAKREKRQKRFRKSFQEHLKDPDYPIKKEGRGTYVVDGMKLKGVANARKLFRFLEEQNIEFETG